MKRIKKLPDTELEVMQAIWSFDPPVMRNQIDEILQNDHPMAQTTLLTLLSRLAEKGFIRIEKVGRSSSYIPEITKEEYLAEQSNRFIDILCGGSISTFANALCNSRLTKEDLNELRSLLDREEL